MLHGHSPRVEQRDGTETGGSVLDVDVDDWFALEEFGLTEDDADGVTFWEPDVNDGLLKAGHACHAQPHRVVP